MRLNFLLGVFATLLLSVGVGAQPCTSRSDPIPLKQEFQSTYLRRELSGFSTYTADTSVPIRKFAKETWSGTVNRFAFVWSELNTTWTSQISGAWEFSKSDFSDASSKSEHRYNIQNYGPQPPVTDEHLTDCLGARFKTFFDSYSGAGATLTQTTASVSGHLPPDQPDPIWKDFMNVIMSGSQSEALSDPFSPEEAIARADRPENIRAQDRGTASLQYWNNYSGAWFPPNDSRRIAPVLFHAQRAAFRVEIPAKPCEQKYQLVLKFIEWDLNGTEPTLPTRQVVAPEQIICDKEVATTWPADGSYKTYEDLGIKLEQGRKARLFSAELVPLNSCSGLPLGQANISLNSVDFALPLGRIDSETGAGVISLTSPVIDASLFTPAALQLTSDPSVEVLRDTERAIRQVSAPQLFVDVVTLSPTSFELRSYLPGQAQSPDPATGIRPVAGAPLKVYLFSGDASGADPTFTITPTDTPLRAAVYSWDAVSGTMSMTQLGGERVESTKRTRSGLSVYSNRTIKNGAGDVVSSEKTTSWTFPFGVGITEVTRGTGAGALTTTTQYYTNSADTANYGRVMRITEPSGDWSQYSYDAQGRVLTELRSYLNSDPSYGASYHRLTTNVYATIPDQDGDGVPEKCITRIQTDLGIETGRVYDIEFSALQTFNGQPTRRECTIRAAAQGAAWDAPSNLVSTSYEIASGNFADKPAASLSVDRVLTTNAYATAPDSSIVTTTDTGAPNPDRTAVVDGVRTVRTTDRFGHLLAETNTDIASGLALESYIITDQDSSGRSLRLDYLDGSFETRTYDCCGLASTTDRHGLTTTYTYDGLGRLETTVRPGLSTRYVYDAAGRRLKTIRIGTDASEITTEERAYDDAGRLVLTKDALGRSTSISSGTGRIVSTTFPGGGTRVDTNATDGRPLKSTGSAVPWQTFAYAINQDGSRSVTEYLPSVAIAETTAWHRNTTDFLGRPSIQAEPDGATGRRFYNALGQLVRTVDPDGVQQLYEYDGQGRLRVSAVDIDRDGVIDYSGPDRVVRTATSYALRSGIVVRRVTTEAFETEGAATPTLVSTTDSTLDGNEAWQTTRGLTTHSVTTYSASGDPTTVVTSPDDTVQTTTFLQTRLASVVTSHPSLGVLSSTSYEYDAHGRQATRTDAAGTTTYSYYADDQIATITTPDPDSSRTGAGYDPQVTSYRYDETGRVDRVTHPDSSETFTTYTPAGQILRTWGSRTYPQAFTYDAQQRVKSLTTWQDFAGQSGAGVTTWDYDPARGWLLTKRDSDGVGPVLAYWPSGRLHTRTWARTVAGQALTTTYAYDPAGELNTITYSDSTPAVSFTYDRLGRLSGTVDAAGSLTRTYENGLLDDEVYVGTGYLSGRSLMRTQDASHRLASLASSSGEVVGYRYDAASRLETITQGVRTALQSYESIRGYPSSLSIRNGGLPRLSSTRTLDKLGRVASVETPGVSSLRYEFNGANQRVKATNLLDGSYWSYGYDSLGQVVAAEKRQSDATPRPGHSFAYSFDDIGNRRSSTINGHVSNYASSSTNAYLNRTLPSILPVLGTAAPAATVRVNDSIVENRVGVWFYHELPLDASAAPQYVQIPVSATIPQGTPPSSELVRSEPRQAFVPSSPEIYEHDADGNLTQDARWRYSWDAENRLASVETRTEVAAAAPGLPRLRLSFAYDASGRRIRKKVESYDPGAAIWNCSSDLRFVYDGWNLVAEFSVQQSEFTLLRSYTWGLDLSGTVQGAGGVGGLLWSVVGNSSHAPAYDGNGNIIAWVDLVSGGKVAENDYDAFGNRISVSGENMPPFGFSTKYTDSETGLLYYGQRYYNPSTGRWLSRDPIEERGGANLYGFVGNNGISRIDILGLEAAPDWYPDDIGWVPRVIDGGKSAAPEIVEATGTAGVGTIATAATISVALVFVPMDQIIGSSQQYDPSNVRPGGPGSINPVISNPGTVVWPGPSSDPSAAAPKYPNIPILPPNYNPKLDNEPGADPVVAVPHNPGDDPNCGCKPCSAPVAWRARGNAHGATTGIHWHWVEWNQIPSGPQKCKCVPKRGAGPSNPNLPGQITLPGVFP